MARITKPSRKTKQPRKQTEYATAFAQDASMVPQFRLARTTRAGALHTWRAWVRFCQDPEIQLCPKPDNLANVKLADLRKFLHWHVNHSSISKLNTLYVFARQFRQAYKLQTGQSLDEKVASEMRHYIENDLRIEFDLREERSDKPVLSVDDLLATLHYHWVLSDDWYSHERQRVQLALMLLIIAYTAARPSAIVDCERQLFPAQLAEDEQRFPGLHTSHEVAGDCLKYKDVKIFKVKGQSSDDHVLLMVITLRLMKGQRNKSLAPKYVFHERDDNLAFCPILHVLALAFADRAFSSPWLTCPEDLYTFQIDEDRGLQAVPLEWRADILETPLLRRTTDETDAWRYEDARSANSRLGNGVGYKDPFNFYQGRRGAGEAINASTSTAVRNRAMGHSRADIFDRYYTNQTVAADTQSAFLGTPSQDWMVTLASHLGLTRDPNAHKLVPKPSSREVDDAPEVRGLLRQKQALSDEIKRSHGNHKAASGTPVHNEYLEVSAQVRAVRLRVSKALYSHKWREHFATIGTTEIERQRTGQELPAMGEAQGEYEFEERARLAQLLSRNDDVTKVEAGKVVERRIQALNAMSGLCRRRQGPRQRRRRSTSPEPLKDEEAGHLDAGGLRDNQCPWCFHDEALSQEQRQYTYSQISKLRHHIEMRHFRQPGGAGAQKTTSHPHGPDTQHRCPFANCGRPHDHDDHLKNHLASCHNFWCAPRTRSFGDTVYSRPLPYP